MNCQAQNIPSCASPLKTAVCAAAPPTTERQPVHSLPAAQTSLCGGELFTDKFCFRAPIDSLFQRTCYLSPVFCIIPQNVVLLFLELLEEKIKLVLFFQIRKQNIFAALGEKVKSVPAATPISAGCFCVLVCGELVLRPGRFSSCHRKAGQNLGKLYL